MIRSISVVLIVICSALSLIAQVAPKKPTSHTQKANANAVQSLPTEDQKDFEDAWRNVVEEIPELVIKSETGGIVWDIKSYREFIQGDAPDSVHPSLWRIAKLNSLAGLFKVTEVPGVGAIYQVRGFDLSNMTIIEANDGVIGINPLTSG